MFEVLDSEMWFLEFVVFRLVEFVVFNFQVCLSINYEKIMHDWRGL